MGSSVAAAAAAVAAAATTTPDSPGEGERAALAAATEQLKLYSKNYLFHLVQELKL